MLYIQIKSILKLKLNKLSVFLIFSLLITNLSAQLNIGSFVGLNSSKFVGDAPYNASYKGFSGINAGLIIDFELSDQFFIGIQPSYSQEGSRVFYKIANNESAIDSVHLRLNYISFPLLFKALSDNKHFYAIGGIEYALLSTSFEKIGDLEYDIPVDLTSWNLAMHFGAGTMISLGRPQLFIEIRYTQGLVNLSDTPIDGSNLPRVKTSGFKFLCGVEMPLNRKSK